MFGLCKSILRIKDLFYFYQRFFVRVLYFIWSWIDLLSVQLRWFVIYIEISKVSSDWVDVLIERLI